MTTTTTKATAVIALSCLSIGATAGNATYTDESTFLNSLSDPFFSEGYETYSVNTQTGSRVINLDYFDVNYQGFSDFGVSDIVDLPNGVQPLAGSQHLQAVYGGGPMTSITFEFNEGTTAFGTYFSDVEARPILYIVTLAAGGSAFSGTVTNGTGNGGVAYWGWNAFGSDIVSIEFRMGSLNGLNGVFFDETTVVPAPGIAAMVLAGLTFTRRRRD